METLKYKLSSRKLWVAISAMLYVVVQVGLGALDVASGVEQVRNVAIGYLAAEGVTDVASQFSSYE